MAYVEIRKDSHLVSRRPVDDEKARTGCKIRLGQAGEAVLRVGESARVGPYDVTVHAGPLPDTDAPPPSHPGRSAGAVRSPGATGPAGAVGTGLDALSAAEAIPDTPQPLPSVDGYRVVDAIGQGGMGTVWRAIQLGTNRPVAMKFLRADKFDSEKSRARFEREVKLASRLEHPHIARIYDSGIHHKSYFYAMELIDGLPMDQHIRDRGLDQRKVLELMRAVCLAVDYAHKHGVIHRDLKPANILVGPDGQPHILDFGLAKPLQKDEGSLTISVEGEASGTPAFMSPEQASGHHEQVDAHSDIYTLGVILYYLLTGQFHHDMSGTHFEILQRIVHNEPRRPSQVSKAVGKDLEAVLLKAISRQPQDRYATAAMLAIDLENHLKGLPLMARSFRHHSAGAHAASAPGAGAAASAVPASASHVVAASAAPASSSSARKRRPKYAGALTLAAVGAVAILLIGGGVLLKVLSQHGQDQDQLQAEADAERARAERDRLATAAELDRKTREAQRLREEIEAARAAGENPAPKPPDQPPQPPEPKPAPPEPKPTPPQPPESPPAVPADLPGVKVYAAWPFDADEATRRQDETVKALTIPKEETLDLGGGVTMKLVLIPAGTFLMGSPDKEATRSSNEGPQHLVTISRPLYVGTAEVTRGQWAAFVAAVGYKSQAERDGAGGVWNGSGRQLVEGVNWRTPGFQQTDDHPVTVISCQDAEAFCQWLRTRTGKGIRLPTEAEWEYACRAGTATAYQWGDRIEDGHGWCNIADKTTKEQFPSWTCQDMTDGYAYTAPVEKFRPNAWGLYDMHGNVWEWCADSSLPYSSASVIDPKGQTLSERALRGGAWNMQAPGYVRSAHHHPAPANHGNTDMGFRAVYTPSLEGRSSAQGPTPASSQVGLQVYAPWPFDAAEAKRRQDETAKALTIRQEETLDLGGGLTLKLVLVPAGKFLMGSPESEAGRRADDLPQHEAGVERPFYLGACEITLDQFDAFVRDTKYQTAAEKKDQPANQARSWRSPGFVQAHNHPVVCIQWTDAVEFCKWLSRKTGCTVRLPTETEWEFACRAGRATAYQWGDRPEDGLGWCNAADQVAKETWAGNSGFFPWADGFAFTSAVGTFRPNPWGLYDMHGNALEWCAESFTREGNEQHVARGGAYRHGPQLIRFWFRNVLPAACIGDDLGFRVAVDLGPDLRLPKTAPIAATQPAPDAKALAAKAKEKFDAIFGAEVRKVTATVDPKDDGALAGKCLDAARNERDDEAYLTVLCENAFTLGAKTSAGFDTACEAMQLLAEAAPDRKADCLAKVVDLRKRAFTAARTAQKSETLEEYLDALAAAGDERAEARDYSAALQDVQQAITAATAGKSARAPDLQTRVKELHALQAAERETQAMTARLKDHPDDEVARGKVLLACLLTRDDPAEAAKYLSDKDDADLRKCLPLAAKGLEDLDEKDRLALATWYRALAEKAAGAGKTNALRRSLLACRAYLASHQADDTPRKAAAMALEKVEQDLARIGDPVTGLGVWTDALRLVDPRFDAFLGKWARQGASIVLESLDLHNSSALTIPVLPDGSYEVSVQFSGGDVAGMGWGAYFIALPVGNRGVVLVLGARSTGGLSRIRGKDCDANETLVHGTTFAPNRTHTAEARVLLAGNQATITAVLNGKPYVQWKGAVSDLSAGWWITGHRLAFGAAPFPSCQLLAFRVRILSGEAKPLRPPPPKTKPAMGKGLSLDLGGGVKMGFVLVPAGKFLMGSPNDEKDRQPNEGPQHEVTIRNPFCMGIFEVTQAQYQAVTGADPSEFKGANRPVETVSWDEAVEFCRKLSALSGKTVRLPTEAEWEYACRAGTTTRFSFGDQEDDLYHYANYADRTCTKPWEGKKDENHSDGSDRTAPVGSLKPNAFGLHDMHGNVWEWCQDWSTDSYANAEDHDPMGPGSGSDRVLRGGCWDVVPSYCRCAYRLKYPPATRNPSFGFRVVVDK